jgi:hypothetical protein
MIKKIAKKILPVRLYGFIKSLIKPTKYHPIAELEKKIKDFGLQKISILTDGETDLSALLEAFGDKIIGIYSFNLDILDQKRGRFTIDPLLANKNIDTDGWIVSALNETATFSLNRFLINSKKENQIILQHLKLPNSTKYYSYADFFHNEQQTIVHINNYFRRCYNLNFPLNLTLTLRDLKGKIIKVSQIILPPDNARIIKSEYFGVENFVGYLEVEFEVSKRVSPFLH